nr:hypothetical protein BaRGS_021973 [Batillaria attramentaria]
MYPPEYAIPIYGYLIPVVVLVTVISDSLLCIVLLKKEIRSPTNALLVAIAISDMLTGLFVAPLLIYFFATDRFWEFVPYKWCWAFYNVAFHTPRTFHTVSVWLTTTLGVQRYICVCHPLKARLWCTKKKTLRWIGAIFITAFLSDLYPYFGTYPVAVETLSAVEANTTVSSCKYVFLIKNKDSERVVYDVDFWYHATAVNFIPCVTLVVMNVLLIRAMRQAEKRRVELLRQNRRRASRRLTESTSTTLMLVIVVSLFLVAEIPTAISDMLTGLIPAPVLIYFFATDRFWEFVPYECFIPCVILVVMNVLLIRAMRQAEKRRVELLRQNRRRESRRLRESTSTTLMLVIVVSLFLLVEIPVGIFKILESPQFANTLGHDVRNSIAITDNLFIVVNNSFIFVVYCTMSKKFRNSLKHLLTPSCRRDTTPEAVEQDV